MCVCVCVCVRARAHAVLKWSKGRQKGTCISCPQAGRALDTRAINSLNIKASLNTPP